MATKPIKGASKICKHRQAAVEARVSFTSINFRSAQWNFARPWNEGIHFAQRQRRNSCNRLIQSGENSILALPEKNRTSSCFNIILCSLLGQVMMAEYIYPDECTMVEYRCVIVNKWFWPNRRSRDIDPRPGVRSPSRYPFRTAMSQPCLQAAGINFPHVGMSRPDGVSA